VVLQALPEGALWQKRGLKKHLLNPRACKFLDSSAAADCTAKEIAQPARKKTDHTVHCTVSYRIYGANFQK